jgi:uncharacterized protein with beta-barrel porin domain
VASSLNRLVAAATGVMADNINNVYDLTDTAARGALSSMTGVAYQHAARSNLGISQAFMAMNLRRLGLGAGGGAMSSGMAVDALTLANAGGTFAGDAAETHAAGRGWWFGGLGGITRYRGNASDAAGRVVNQGLIAGIDRDITPNVTLGVSGGEASPRLQLDNVEDHGTSHMWQAGAYGRVRHARSRIDGVLNLGTQRSSMWRTITDGVISPGASASYGGRSVSSQVEYGYSFAVTNGLTIEPQGGVQYGRLWLDGVTEAGADALGLVVPARRVSSRRTLAGGKVTKALELSPARLTFEGRASWAHELSPLGDIGMRFAGDSVTDGFSVAAPDQLRNSAVIGFSIAGNTRRLRVIANVDSEISGPTNGWSGSIGLNRSW